MAIVPASMLVLTLSSKAIVRDTAKAHDRLALQDAVIAFVTRRQFEIHGTPDSIQVQPISQFQGIAAF